MVMGAKSFKNNGLGKMKIKEILILIGILFLIGSFVYAQDVVEQFKTLNGREWGVEVSEWGIIISAVKERPVEIYPPINEQQAIQIADDFLIDNAAFFGMESLNFTDTAIIKDAEGRDSWVITYEGQVFKGIPVLDTHTTVIMTMDGQIFAVGNLRYVFEEEVNTIPTISEEEAENIARGFLSIDEQPIDTSLNLLVEDNETKLVWNVLFGEPINKEVLINAKTGDVLGVNIVKLREKLLSKISQLYSLKLFLILFVLGIFSIVCYIIIKKSKKKKRKKSKGVGFSIIVVIIALTLVSFIALQRSVAYRQREKLFVEARINDINNLYESAVRDVNKALEIITRRAIATCISYVITEGEGLDQADFRIEELVLNGTLYGNPKALMENSTLPDWINRIEQVGNVKGYDIDLVFYDFKIKPYDSWNLLIESKLTINITDQQGVASIIRNVDIEKKVPITGFEDPIYSLNTNGRATNIISKTPYDGNFTILLVSGSGSGNWVYGISVVIASSNSSDIEAVQNKGSKILVTDDATSIDSSLLNSFLGIVSENGINNATTTSYIINASNAMSLVPNNTNILLDGETGKVWYIDNLKKHTENSYYYISTNGASFLDRLEGKLTVQSKYSNQTTNVIGIESFINKDYFESIEIVVVDKTNTDFLYFSNATIDGDMVKGLDSSFKIDNENTLGSTRQEVYGVSQLTIG